jgi:hypothetical protein
LVGRGGGRETPRDGGSGVRIPVGARDVFLLENIPPTFISNGYRGWEVVGAENTSPPATTEVKNEWSYTPLPYMPSGRGEGEHYPYVNWLRF